MICGLTVDVKYARICDVLDLPHDVLSLVRDWFWLQCQFLQPAATNIAESIKLCNYDDWFSIKCGHIWQWNLQNGSWFQWPVQNYNSKCNSSPTVPTYNTWNQSSSASHQYHMLTIFFKYIYLASRLHHCPTIPPPPPSLPPLSFLHSPLHLTTNSNRYLICDSNTAPQLPPF